MSSSLAATDAAAAAVAAGVAGVGEALRQRLDLPIHQRMNRASTRATLGYLFNNMRCGIYVMIRHGAVRMFVPFVNAAYTNSWSAALHWSGKGPGGERDGSDPELGQDVRGYYEAKQQRAGCREENVIPDVGEWWANGNIICNEHCPPGQDQSQYWGDQLLVPLRDMLHELCDQRQVRARAVHESSRASRTASGSAPRAPPGARDD